MPKPLVQAHGHFGEGERTFTLERAILLYSENRSTVAATIHDVQIRHGKPVIEEGRPITIAALEGLAAALGRQMENTLMPERILSLSLTRMSWWLPGGRRRIWFSPSNEDKDGAKLLKALNGKVVRHPALLFVASQRSLRVFALANSERPKATTRVYVAPYFNLDNRGVMCRGSVKLPDLLSPAQIPGFERAWFDSAFSHSSAGRLTLHPQGHTGLWQEMARRSAAFKKEYLVPTNHNVEQLLRQKDHE